MIKMDSISFRKLRIELLSRSESQPLSPFLEDTYQILASEALEDFEDRRAIDCSFQCLIQELNNEERNPIEMLDRSRETVDTVSPPSVGATTSSASNVNVHIRKGAFDRSDLFRKPVKERRRMFEPRATSGTASSIRSAKKVKRTDSLKEKRRFWESRSCAEIAVTSNDRESHRNSNRKVGTTVSLKERCKFWESVAEQEETVKHPKLTLATEAPASGTEETGHPTSLASPGNIVEHIESDSGHNSHTESQPECDQECEEAAEVFERSVSSNRCVVTPATTGYDNISLDELYYSTTQRDSRSDLQKLVTCSGSASLEDGGAGFIYDEFDEFNIGEYDSRNNERHNIIPTPQMFQLNSQFGKMLGMNPEKAHAFGSGLSTGQVNVTNVFTVKTRGAGAGFLTVGIQGATGTAKIITQKEVDEFTHQVSYTVSRPGYYMIFVRWGDCHIMDSPFVSQVSDPAAIM